MFFHHEFHFVFDGISESVTEKAKDLISQTGLLTASKILGYDPVEYENLIVAGRLLIFNLRRKCAQNIKDYANDFKESFKPEYYEYFKNYAEVMQTHIDKQTKQDYDVDYFSASSKIKNYLLKLEGDDEPSENFQQACFRVAVQTYSHCTFDRVVEYFYQLSNMLISPPSPVWFNACKIKNYLTSCFLATIQDDMTDIQFITGHTFAQVSKGCGAMGMDLSRLRHSEIAGGGESSGILNLLQKINSNCRYCDQVGLRKGSASVNLRTHHIDLIEFIGIVSKVGDRYSTCHDIYNSVYYSDIFMDRVKEGAKDGLNWTLMCPGKTSWLNDLHGSEFTKEYIRTEALILQHEKEYEIALQQFKEVEDTEDIKIYREYRKKMVQAKRNRIQHKRMNAYEIMKIIADMQQKTSMPYLNSCDSTNLKSNQNNLGYISGPNLCQEITLHSGIDKAGNKCIASCNLSSIPLASFTSSKVDRTVVDKVYALRNAYNFDKLGYIIKCTVTNIDYIINQTRYALDTEDNEGIIHKTNKRNRPIGIGTQGFAEMLYELDLRIEEDKEYVSLLNKMVFACMYFNGVTQSIVLAILDGKYENFEGSPLSKGLLQPDLWRKETTIRKVGKDHPGHEAEIDPKSWNQNRFILPNNDVIEPTWQSLREKVIKYGVRNSTIFAMMPTATSAQISRNTETNEMPSSCLYSRKLISGNFPVLVRHLVQDLKEINLWNKHTFDYLQVNNGSIQNFDSYVQSNVELFGYFKNFERLTFLIQKYKTMFEVSQKYMLKLSADRSMYICNSSSQNIYIANPTENVLIAAHLYSHSLGLKNLMYYLRQGSALESIKFTLDPEIVKKIQQIKNNELEKLQSLNYAEREKELPVCDPNNKNCISCQS